MHVYRLLKSSISRQIAIYRATSQVARMHEILEDLGKNAALFRTYALTSLSTLHTRNCEQIEAELEALYQRYVKLKHA